MYHNEDHKEKSVNDRQLNTAEFFV